MLRERRPRLARRERPWSRRPQHVVGPITSITSSATNMRAHRVSGVALIAVALAAGRAGDPNDGIRQEAPQKASVSAAGERLGVASLRLPLRLAPPQRVIDPLSEALLRVLRLLYLQLRQEELRVKDLHQLRLHLGLAQRPIW